MNTYNDWHLWRELVLLTLLGLFVLVAVLAGMLESRRKARRHAAALTWQDTAVSSKTRTPRHDVGSQIPQQTSWLDRQAVATHTTRTA